MGVFTPVGVAVFLASAVFAQEPERKASGLRERTRSARRMFDATRLVVTRLLESSRLESCRDAISGKES
jgi:hypothetical protein